MAPTFKMPQKHFLRLTTQGSTDSHSHHRTYSPGSSGCRLARVIRVQAAPGGGLWAPSPCGPPSSLLGHLLLQHQGRRPPNTGPRRTWSGRAPGLGFIFYSSVMPQPETSIISRTPSSTGRQDTILASCTLLSQQHHCRQGPGPAPSPLQPEDSFGCRCILPKIPRVHFYKTLLLPRDSCVHTSRDGGQEDQSGRVSTAT